MLLRAIVWRRFETETSITQPDLGPPQPTLQETMDGAWEFPLTIVQQRPRLTRPTAASAQVLGFLASFAMAAAPAKRQPGAGSSEDDFEEALAKHSAAASASSGSTMLQAMLSQLQQAVYTHGPSNAEQNAKLWDLYAAEHADAPAWLQHMASSVGREPDAIVGSEWSDAASLDAVLEEWVLPHLPSGGAVAEVAVGGGRIAMRIAEALSAAGSSARLVVSDVSQGMLRRAQEALRDSPVPVEFLHTPSGEGAQWQAAMAGQVGDTPVHFIVCFDAMVHMDVHTVWAYLQAMHSVLAPGGAAFISTSNIASPAGWQRFTKQRRGTVGGFAWMSPDTAKLLASKAGFAVEAVAAAGPGDDATGNLYVDRDCLLLLRKTAS